MIVVLASLTLLSVQPRHASKESKPKQELELEFEIQANEPDDHYPLTCTQNGVWMLGNLNTCRFLPLPGGEAKNSNLMMFYEVHEHDQLEQEGHTGELSIILYSIKYSLLPIVIFA